MSRQIFVRIGQHTYVSAFVFELRGDLAFVQYDNGHREWVSLHGCSFDGEKSMVLVDYEEDSSVTDIMEASQTITCPPPCMS